MAKRQEQGLTLQACAVNIVRDYPHEVESEQVAHMKDLAARRGVQWRYGHEIAEALARARRYEP